MREVVILKIKQKILLPAAVILAAMMVVIAVWYFFPKTFLRGTELSSVKSISVFDGNTGIGFDIEDPAEIEHILKNIQSVRMRKDGISTGKMGYRFRMCFYNGDGKELDGFIINSADTIRDDPFFYRGKGGLCIDYLAELEKKYTD